MTLATDIVTFIGNNPEATSLDGSVSENLFAASVEHYKARVAIGHLGLTTVPTLVAQSFAGWSRTSVNAAGDTTYVTVASVSLPAGTMGLNSKLVIIPEWDYPASASRKLMSVDFGGTLISTIDVDGGNGMSAYRMGKILLEVQNLNSLSSQKTMNGSSYGISANPRLASTINTANAVAIDFKVKWNAQQATTETITLLGYSIWHHPGS